MYLEVETTSSTRVTQRFNDIVQTMVQDGVAPPLKGKIESRLTELTFEKHGEFDMGDPDALLRPVELFKDFVRFKEGTDATEEQIRLFSALVNKHSEI